MADVGKKSIGQMGALWNWTSNTTTVTANFTDYATSAVRVVANNVTNYDNGTIYFAISNTGALGANTATSYLTVSTTAASAVGLVFVAGSVPVKLVG